MKTVKGTWTFKDVLTNTSFEESVNFVCDNQQFSGIKVGYGGGLPFEALFYFCDDGTGEYYEQDVYIFEEDAELGAEVGWEYEPAKTIDFGETEQTVSDAFYAFQNKWGIQNIDDDRVKWADDKPAVRDIDIIKDWLTARIAWCDTYFGYTA